MRIATRENCADITATCLKLLLATGGMTMLAILSGGRSSDKIAVALGGYGRRKVRAVMSRMRLRGYIRYDPADETSPIVLTGQGIRRARRYERLDITLRRIRKWDHLWRILLFDVPERTKRRRPFQRWLKRNGWFKIQDSVYAHPHHSDDELAGYDSWRTISRHCLVILAPSLGAHENRARRHYAIPAVSCEDVHRER